MRKTADHDLMVLVRSIVAGDGLVLLESGASIKEKDNSGKTVDQAATAGWIRQMLRVRH